MKKLLILSLALNVLAIAWKLSTLHKQSKSLEQADETRKAVRKAKADYRFSLPCDSIVFVGTSLTEGFAVTELFGACNRGIPGMRASEVLERIDCLKNADIIFLEIGINDLCNGTSPDSLYRVYNRILSCLKCKVVKQSVPYISVNYQSDAKEVNEKIRKFNSLIHPDIILPSGDSLTYDGLHYNKRGYEVWRDLISSSFPVSAK